MSKARKIRFFRNIWFLHLAILRFSKPGEYHRRNRDGQLIRGRKYIVNGNDGCDSLSVQISELSEVTELRWDGATELVMVEVPK